MGVALVMAQSSPLEHAGWRGWGWKSGGGRGGGRIVLFVKHTPNPISAFPKEVCLSAPKYSFRSERASASQRAWEA